MRRCMYCGRGPLRGNELNYDHIIPRKQGGNNKRTNLIESCATCNRRKNNRTPEEFREAISASVDRLILGAADRLKTCSVYMPEDKVNEALNHLWMASILMGEMEVSFYYESICSGIRRYDEIDEEAA